LRFYEGVRKDAYFFSKCVLFKSSCGRMKLFFKLGVVWFGLGGITPPLFYFPSRVILFVNPLLMFP